ncbi:hypothetical protein [Aeromonas phage AerS_266]|nr:hypothetical protein [Aeromonas phage AerS_266]
MCHKCFQKYQASQQTENTAIQGVVGVLKSMFPDHQVMVVEMPGVKTTESLAVKFAGDLLDLVDTGRDPEWIGITVGEKIQHIPTDCIKDVIDAYCGNSMPIQMQHHNHQRAVLYGLVMADAMTKVSRNEHEENVTAEIPVIDDLLIASLEKMVIDFATIGGGDATILVDNISPAYHRSLLKHLVGTEGFDGPKPNDSQKVIRDKLIKTIEVFCRHGGNTNEKPGKQVQQKEKQFKLQGSYEALYKELCHLITTCPRKVETGICIPFIEMMEDDQVKAVIELFSHLVDKERTTINDRKYLSEICINLAKERAATLESNGTIREINTDSDEVLHPLGFKTPKQALTEIWNKDPDVVKFIKKVNELGVNQLLDYLHPANGNRQVARFLLTREITGRNLMLAHFVK